MEFLIFLLTTVTLVLVISVRNSIARKLDGLQHTLDELSRELRRLRTGQGIVDPSEKKSALPGEAPSPVIPAQKPAVTFAVPERKPPEQDTQTKPPQEKRLPEESVIFPGVVEAKGETETVQAAEPKKPGFFERNPDLEKFIGENLANKIGIGILVLGIGFFVKYAIDQDWINEIGRVFIGILSGGILLGIAHRMRKTFIAFSSVMVGGGIAVLYLTIAIAFHEYAIFSQTAAFVLMLVITVFAVVLSLGYNRMELAILAILGGFASPFMVSTGEGNYVVLFIYVLILDCGMLALAYHKKWNPVNLICYAFTVLLFGSWLGARFDGEQLSMIGGAMVFATLFYLVFFAMNIVNNIRRKTPFKAVEIGILLSNTFFFYAAGMVILDNEYGQAYRGLFTAVLGIFNFIFAYALYRDRRVDKNLVFLLIGLVLTFISLAAPVQLEGNYITLFWAAESVLLLWLSQQSGIRLMKLASVIITGLMVISLVMDWELVYFNNSMEGTLQVVLNKGYITGLVAIAAIAGLVYLLRRERGAYQNLATRYKSVLTGIGLLLLYVSQLLELRYQLFEFGVAYAAQNVIIGSYNMAFILALLFLERKLVTLEVVRKYFAFLGFLVVVLYLLFYHDQIITTRNQFLYGLESSTGFVFHYLFVAISLVVAGVSLKKMQQLTAFNKKTHNIYSWVFVFFFVFIASAELDHTVLLTSYTPDSTAGQLLSQNHKIGFPILWGISSFVLIAIGLKFKKKHLRIISLTLFLITLLKLFLIDIRGISEGGKIAAFISLGILLLIVSFMYQRLKRLLLADEVVQEGKDEQGNKVP